MTTGETENKIIILTADGDMRTTTSPIAVAFTRFMIKDKLRKTYYRVQQSNSTAMSMYSRQSVLIL